MNPVLISTTAKYMATLIASGKKTKEALLAIIDVFLMSERISPDEYVELKRLIDEKYPTAPEV